MKLTLLSRLVISYLIIFILVIAVCVYAIIRIGQFNGVIQSVLMTNGQIVNSAERLTDTLLSLNRYERKFLITSDQLVRFSQNTITLLPSLLQPEKISTAAIFSLL